MSKNKQRKYPNDPRLSNANFEEILEELFANRELTYEQRKEIEERNHPLPTKDYI